MIWIRDWDFNWQGGYLYQQPVNLPKGTVVKVDSVYDNSAANPKNPSSPPKRVRWGEQTTDEMCLCGMTVITKTPADLWKVGAMNFAQLGAVLGGGALPTERPNPPANEKPPVIDPKTREAVLSLVPAEGFPIPEEYRVKLAIFDHDHDGRLTRKEIEAMPEPARSKVIDGLRIRMGVKTDAEKAK